MRTRWVVRLGVAAGVTALVVPAGCTGSEDEQVRVVAPSAVAEAAGDVTSGRFTVSDLGMTASGRFQDDDVAVVMDFGDLDGVGGEAGEDDGGIVTTFALPDGPLETRIVDGVMYTQNPADPERWQRMTDFMSGMSGDPGLEGGWQEDPLGTMVDVLEQVTVDTPGEPAVVNGQAVTRYQVTLEDSALDEALGFGEDYDDEWAPEDEFGVPEDDPLWAEYDARLQRIDDYEREHRTATVSAYLDAQGTLVQAELTASVDLSEYPDCWYFSYADTDLNVVFTDLGAPQQIEAPPAGLVDDWELPGAEELGIPEGMMEDVMNGEMPDAEDLAAMAEELGLDPALVDEMLAGLEEGGPFGDSMDELSGDVVLQTSAGPRKRNVVIRSLIEWATERGIDWTKVPPPDDAGLVAMYDLFFAEELKTRGPALTTTDGLWSRGDVVDLLTVNGSKVGVDPSTVATMSDEQLVERFNQLLALGDPALVGLSDEVVPNMYGLEEDLEGCPG